MFDQSALVLEGVTLAQMVEFVVEMLVDLAGRAVFDQETAEDAKAAHPHHLAVTPPQKKIYVSKIRSISAPTSLLVFAEEDSVIVDNDDWEKTTRMIDVRRHPSIGGTLPLPETSMSTNPPRSGQLPRPRT